MSSFNEVVYDLQLLHDVQSFFEPFMLFPNRRILIEKFRLNLKLIKKVCVAAVTKSSRPRVVMSQGILQQLTFFFCFLYEARCRRI